MSKFLLHRITRMVQNPATEEITPGLEAAAYLHWIACYEHDPKEFVAVEEQLPALRKHVAEYFELTARETSAHLELMEATRKGDIQAVGTQDFQPAPDDGRPLARVGPVSAQYGLNWALFYWKAPPDSGQPWGYRLYRTDKGSAPVLVHTAVGTEALVCEQPQRVKFYYYVTAFNGTGETAPSPDFGVMFDAPDEPQPSQRA